MICARTQCILIVSWYAGLVAWRCGPYTNASGSQSIAAVYSVRGDPSRDIVLPMLVKLDKCTPRLPGQSKGVIARRDGRSPVAEGCRCPTLSSFVDMSFWTDIDGLSSYASISSGYIELTIKSNSFLSHEFVAVLLHNEQNDPIPRFAFSAFSWPRFSTV